MRVRRPWQLFWGGVLVLAGILFLLNTMGVLSFSVWGVLWPLFLIIAGVFILLGFNSRWWGAGEAERVMLPLEGAERASIHVEGTAGVFTLKAASEETPNALVVGDFYGGVEFKTSHHQGELVVRMKPPAFSGGNWEFGIKKGIPVRLKLDGGAGPAELDLTDLHVTELKTDGRAGPLTIHMPAQVPYLKAKIDGGLGPITITMPEGVAARISYSSGLGSQQVAGRYMLVGENTYESPDFATSERKIEMKIDGGIGGFTVR